YDRSFYLMHKLKFRDSCPAHSVHCLFGFQDWNRKGGNHQIRYMPCRPVSRTSAAYWKSWDAARHAQTIHYRLSLSLSFFAIIRRNRSSQSFVLSFPCSFKHALWIHTYPPERSRRPPERRRPW